MSVEYQASIVVGLPFDRIKRVLNTKGFLDDIHHSLEDLDMEVIPEYYDAPLEDSIIGIVIQSSKTYGHTILDLNEVNVKIAAAKMLFKSEFGVDAAVILCTNGH